MVKLQDWEVMCTHTGNGVIVTKMNYVNGVTAFTEIELETAKSSLTFEVIERETTVTEVSTQDLLKLISKVTLADLKRAGKLYISALFDESQIRRAVVCNQSKVQEVVDSFKELKVDVKVIPSLEEDFLCAL
ncbi:hypothetical protein MAR_032934 [Mya arenaria]|uniref:Uncharacterized protein n=1 Tax=Mya arenaria TaxID=6604 RepID=A0ABY7G921_MYAAR|nr:hypothetical protein MAR_032934 [Mya arenaria]